MSEFMWGICAGVILTLTLAIGITLLSEPSTEWGDDNLWKEGQIKVELGLRDDGVIMWREIGGE